MIDLKEAGKNLYSGMCEHSPEILIGIGIAGMVTGTVLAVRSTPKAIELLEKRKKKLDSEKIPVGDIVKTTWKCYIPTIVVTSLSIACIIFADRQHVKRTVALSTACSLSETAFQTYKAKVIETIGEKKEKSIRDDIAKDEICRNPVGKKEIIVVSNATGDTLCFDTISARYFKSDIEKIRKIEAQLNRDLYSDMFVSLNDFYYALGLSPSSIGDDIGWNVDNGPINLEFSSQLSENDVPCLVINSNLSPRFDYRELH